MRYRWVWIGLLAAVGCQNNQMNFDPFSTSGPALMPPPGTGSAGRPDPYYRPSTTTPVPGATGAYRAAPLPAQYARFTSQDGTAAPQVADQPPDTPRRQRVAAVRTQDGILPPRPHLTPVSPRRLNPMWPRRHHLFQRVQRPHRMRVLRHPFLNREVGQLTGPAAIDTKQASKSEIGYCVRL